MSTVFNSEELNHVLDVLPLNLLFGVVGTFVDDSSPALVRDPAAMIKKLSFVARSALLQHLPNPAKLDYPLSNQALSHLRQLWLRLRRF